MRPMSVRSFKITQEHALHGNGAACRYEKAVKASEIKRYSNGSTAYTNWKNLKGM